MSFVGATVDSTLPSTQRWVWAEFRPKKHTADRPDLHTSGFEPTADDLQALRGLRLDLTFE